MSDSAGTSRARSKVERGKELLQTVYENAQAYNAANEQNRDVARERYFRALNRFNDFVLHGIDSDQP